MRHPDPEKLLGGYAAGILTETEKTALFAAALEHQELFDALADEEALRELLADPTTRRHLLALLEEPRAQRPIPLWRRPATLGLAAGLLLMVTTSLVMWQREHPVLPSPGASFAKTEADAAPSAAAGLGTAARKQATKDSDPEPAPSKPMDISAPATPAPLANRATEVPSPAPQKAEAALKPDGEAKKRMPTEGLLEVAAAAAPTDRTETKTSTSFATEKREEPPTQPTLEGNAALARSATAGGASALSRAKGKAIPVPTWVLEPIGNGELRLTLTWATGNHLYLLKRTPLGTESLAPQATTVDPGGTTRSVFVFALSAQEHLDLYLLHRPEPHPESLPAAGAVDGYRKRVR